MLFEHRVLPVAPDDLVVDVIEVAEVLRLGCWLVGHPSHVTRRV